MKTRQEATYVHSIEDEEEDMDPWFVDILKYLQTHEYPPHFSNKDRRAMCLQAANFHILNGQLCRRGQDSMHL